MSIEIRQANLTDTKAIMQFIDEYWRKDHILAKHEKFFLYEFQKDNMLNIIIALENNNIVGFLGYFYYNTSSSPHMAGSIWKTHPEASDQLLGVKIRSYFQKNIKHQFFATPGPGLHMKPVYKMLRMNWYQMDQYYIANDKIKEYKLISNPQFGDIKNIPNSELSFHKAKDLNDIKSFQFDQEVVPTKDLQYIQKRFFNHPVYEYIIYYIKNNDTIENIIVTRVCEYQNNKACRIVDLHGPISNMQTIVLFLYKLAIDKNYEYIDFISNGYDQEMMLNAGFSKVDFETNHTIVPNYFEPFVQSNVPVYCVCDKTDKTYRQHKADGDMDRPTIIKKGK